MADIDFAFIARQNERLLTELGALRDEVRVQSAITIRLDSTMNALLTEVRETHIQIGRMNDRIRRLEETANPPTAPA